MKLDALLRDVTGSPEGASQRSQHQILTDMLNARHGDGSISLKGVAKWFERKAIPGHWLMRIAALPNKPVNLSKYN